MKFKDKDLVCPECKGIEFIGIPDSLACACENCGYVWVLTNDGPIKGASLQEWAKDLYENKKT